MVIFLLGAAMVAAAPVAPAPRRQVVARRRTRPPLTRPEREVEPVIISAPAPVVPPPTMGPLGAELARVPQPEIPPEMRAMMDAAIQANDDAAVDVIVKYARAADPGSRDLVLRRATEWRNARARARDQRVRQAGAFQLWSGRAEAGGFISTGNSDVTGLTGALDLTREGLRWRHRILAQADFQRTGGVTSRERYVAGYQPNYKINDRGYVYGNAQYEADRFLGYDSRYSVSAGAGYGVLRRTGLTLDLELGPAFRQTDFTDARMQSSAAVRGSVELDWTIVSGLSITQDSSAYLERYNSTVRSVTAIEAKLLGPLSARFSYTVQYESQPPDGRLTTDATSRASIVYAF